MPNPTFYTVADSLFFPGVVALLNSLRLTDNEGDLVVLDVGLEASQRNRLRAHTRLVPLPAAAAASAYLAKPFAYRIEAAGTLVILDSDMLVTSSLAGIVGQAEAGRICVFPDHPTTRGRWFAEWHERFGLAEKPRRQTYVNAGFVALSLGRWRHVVERWWQACGLIPPNAHFASDLGPFWAGDQDALNALLMSEVPADALAILPANGEVYWDELDRVEVVDERTLECRLRGSAASILHYSFRPKPWERASWARVVDDAYLRLLPRVLFADDVPLRLDPMEFPIWMRPSRAGRATLRTLAAGHRSAKAALRAAPGPLGSRLRPLRDAIFRRLGR